MTRAFKELQNDWYGKLASDGFIDAENVKHPNRPLIEWHSFKMTSQKFQINKANKSLYQNQIDNFLIHPKFDEICKSVVKHGNCKFCDREVMVIWEMHTEGLTTRQIASHMNRVKSRIDDVIGKLRQWMNLL